MKKVLKYVAIVLTLLLIVIGAYAGYVFSTYYRLPDKLTLEVNRNGANFYFEEEKAYEPGQYYWAMTYNIGFGAYQSDYSFFMDGGKSSWAEDEDSVIANTSSMGELVITANPDFIFLQEVDIDGTRSYHVNQLELLNHFIKGYYYTFAQNYDSPFLFFPPWEPHGANEAGIVTYSKGEISEGMRRSLPISDSFSKFTDLDRCYSVSRVPVEDGKSLCLYNVHLSAYSSDEVRKAQLDMLFGDMQADYEQGNYVICGGDFNHNLKLKNEENTSDLASFFPRESLPEGFYMGIDELRAEEDVWHDTCRDAGEPYVEGDTETVTLDGFILSDNVAVNYYYHMDWGYEFSDHEPVIMQFKMEE